jgi:hypothetical protein
MTFLIQSCSKIDTAYNYAPGYSTDFLDRYFDFTSERYDKVKEALEKDFKNNKAAFKSALKKRLASLSELNDKKEISEQKVEEFISDYRSLQAEVVDRFKPSLKEIIMNMTKDELKHLKKETEDKHRENFETLENKDSFLKKELKRFKKNMSSIFDSVTDEQEQIYTGFVEQNFPYYKAQLEFRKSYLVKLESLFDNKEQMLDAAIKYYSGDDSVKPKEFLEKHKIFMKNMNILIQKIWKSLTDKQREEYKKTLVELNEEIDELK